MKQTSGLPSFPGEDDPQAPTPPPGTATSRRAVMVAGGTALVGMAAACSTLSQIGPPLSTGSRPVPEGSAAPRGRLEKRVVCVTGAARGIGRAICVGCAREGADVVGLDIAAPVSPVVPYPAATPEDLQQTGRLVEEHGHRFRPIIADVRDARAMREAAVLAIRDLGQVDVLVANAGIMSPLKLMEMTDRSWRDVVDVNLTGVANSIRAFMLHMVERKYGRIIAISSIEGRQGESYAPQYVASKWGVIGLVKSAALELGPSGITVNAVCPTAVNTPMFRNPAQYSAMAPPQIPRPPPEDAMIPILTLAHPLRVPWVEPEDVAATVTFLASQEARLISGAVFDVSAGFSAQFTG